MLKKLLFITLVFMPMCCVHAQAPGGGNRAVAVIVAPVQARSLTTQFEVLATVLANESVAISAPVADTVSRIAFREGAQVQQGDILLELTHAAESADLQAAQAVMEERRRTLERTKELQGRSLSSVADLDLAATQLRSAQAQVAALQAAVDDRVLRAPFAGVLGLREISPGAYVQAGQRITSLHDVSTLKLEFDLPQSQLHILEKTYEMWAHAPDEAGQEYRLQPDAQAVALDIQSRSMRMRARLASPSSKLRPGALMVVQVRGPARSALLVPEAAIIPREDQQIVYVRDAEHVQSRQIKTGLRRDGYIEIIEGVTAGEEVVVHGGDKLRPGATVQVLGVYDGSVPISLLIRQAQATP